MKKISAFILIFVFIASLYCLCDNNDSLERAVTLYKWKYYDDAITELDKLIQTGQQPWLFRAEFLKAYCLIKKGNTGPAKAIFARLSQNPDFALYDYAKYALAQTHYDAGQYQAALDQYSDFFSDSALKPEADIKKAECLANSGNLTQAINIYKLAILEGNTLAPLDKARFNLAKCYEKIGNPKAAIKAYHEVNLYHPLSPLARNAVVRVGHLSRKYNIYPGAASAEDLFNKAMIFYNFGDYASAGLFFQQITNNYKASNLWEDALFKSAMCDYNRKRLRSSIQKFQRCVNYGGDYAPAAQFHLSFAYGKGGYFYQALESLNKVITNYPNSAFADDAAYWLGYYYEANGFKDAALAQYERFVAQYDDKSEFLDDTYWRIGRLYYFKKDYMKSYEAFKNAVEKCGNGNILDGCAYWKGLCQEKLGDRSGAEQSFNYVISRYDHTFFSYRAREKLVLYGKEIKDEFVAMDDLPYIGQANDSGIPLYEEPLPFESGIEDNNIVENPQTIKISNLKDHFKKYTELMAIGFYEEAALEASILIESSPEDKKMSAKLALSTAQLASGKVRDSILYAETLCNKAIENGNYRDLPKLTWQLAYPKGYYSHIKKYASQYGIEEALVLAVIREESRFNPKTVSWANARGLMQIIPPTGRNVARLIGIKSYYTSKLNDPETNIKMGCYYLSQLLKRFDGNKIYALAAYNGGPQRIKKWINRWPIVVGENIDTDEFIESIPLSETRRYVQKVMKSYFEYKRLYTEG